MANNDSICEKVLKVENKQVFLDLKSNQNGVYLKISERRGTNRNSVLIPASGIQRLNEAIDEIYRSEEYTSHVGGKVSGNATKSKGKKEKGAAAAKSQPREREEASSTVLFVSNLTWATTEVDLIEHMKQAGAVVRAEILKRGDRSKGTGLVEYASPQIAHGAIDFMNDSELDGRKIRVRADKGSLKPVANEGVAVEATEGKQRKKKAEKAPKEEVPLAEKVLVPNKIFIRNLAWQTTQADLIGPFSKFGEISSAEIRATQKGRSLGNGVVVFANEASAKAAIEGMNGVELDGRKIGVREYFEK